jgi:hypothetical protein
MIRTVTAMRYVVPLREGGSLPAVVEADDGVLYVMKFVGAGQGPKALIAELIAGEIGRALGLNVPEIVLMKMSPLLGRAEPNPEIRSLLQASTWGYVTCPAPSPTTSSCAHRWTTHSPRPSSGSTPM